MEDHSGTLVREMQNLPPSSDILLLDRPLSKESCGASHFVVAFQKLPMAAVTGDGDKRKIVVLGTRQSYPRQLVRILGAIDELLTIGIDVINISLGPATLLDHSEDNPDPLYTAIKTAVVNHHVPVVVAAGNGGPHADTLQFLARSLDVISVGAVDEDGSLVESSSRGVRGVSGPTVVADGVIDKEDPRFQRCGTSWAAPKISVSCAWMRHLLEIIAKDVSSLYSGEIRRNRRLKIPRIGLIDTGATEVPERTLTGTDFPIRQRHIDWYTEVFKLVHRWDLEPYISNDVATVKRSLQSFAKPIPGCGLFEVGAGDATGALADFVEELYPSKLIEIFCRGNLQDVPTFMLDEEIGPLWDWWDVDIIREHMLQGVLVTMVKVV